MKKQTLKHIWIFKKKTDVHNIVATITKIIDDKNSKIEYVDENGEKKEETIQNSNYIKKDEGVDSPWKIDMTALKGLKI